MSSLRKSIVVRVILLVAAVGLSAAALSFVLVTIEIDKFLDAQLQEIAINIGPTKPNNGDPLFETEDEDHLLVQVWDRSGKLVHRSGPPVDIPWQAHPGLTDVSDQGQEWRVYRWSNAQYDIQVGQTWSARREIAVHAATGAALPLLLAIPFAWLLMGWSINRTMRGLHRLSAEIGQRSVDAREPLRPVGVPEEVAPLIVAIDRLVARQREALEAQRRFVADAAHELRTPLAALQIQTENLLAGDIPNSTRELADELGDGVRRASHLASQLLELARTEGSSQSERQSVELEALVRSLLADFHPQAAAKNIQLEMIAEKSDILQVDREAVRKIIGILLDNAIRYSEPGHSVSVRITKIDDTNAIEVIDEGPGISSDAMPYIYDRFFRAAPQSIEGTGLGLAIAKSAAHRQGLDLVHQNRDDKTGVIARITFPPL